jgi:hypothetical protein
MTSTFFLVVCPFFFSKAYTLVLIAHAKVLWIISSITYFGIDYFHSIYASVLVF